MENLVTCSRVLYDKDIVDKMKEIVSLKKDLNKYKTPKKIFTSWDEWEKIRYEYETKINNCLNNRRDGVKFGKKTRMNAGMENQFLKKHTKDKSKNPTKVRKIKVATKNDDIINNRAIYEDISRIKKLLK